MLEEFKKFALKGNMLELAIGVIIGTTFSGLVNSVVNDMFMPVLGVLTGGLDFSNIYWQMVGVSQPNLDAARKAGATLAYGHFITIFINFLIITFILFLVVKGLNKMQLTHTAADAVKAPKSRTEKALEEIIDIMKRENSSLTKIAANSGAAKKTAPAAPAKPKNRLPRQ